MRSGNPLSGTGTAQQRISADKSQIVRLYGRTAQSAAKISAERQIDTGALCAGNRFFRMLKLNQSLKILNELIAEEPENPYFHELKGQIFMETGK